MSATTGRGEKRRAALVRAAAGLLREHGPSAVTARAVSARARVPLAAVTYYFASVDDLVRDAAETVFAAHREAAEAVVRDGAAARWQETLVRVWFDPSPGGPDQGRVRGVLEQVLAAAGTPSLRASTQRWDAEVVRLVQSVLSGAGRDTSRTRLLLAALDGAALARLGGVDAATGRPVEGGDLLDGLVADLQAVADDLAPATGRQNRRAVGSSRPDSPT